VTAISQTEEEGRILSRRGPQEFPLSEDDYRMLTAIVYDRSGIVLGPNKVNMVYSRLVRRLRELQLPSFRAYCDLLNGEGGADELGMLINAITTNLTRFFREVHHFDHLRDVVVPGIADCKAPRRMRIWSAGCSSGEEPYSIAMTLTDAIPNLDRWDVRILATDLDTTMVSTGSAGIYAADAVAELPKATQGKYFRRLADDPDKAQVSEKIRKLITFKSLNLLGAWPMKGPFDAIFCRNVMIYFDAKTKIALVNRYAQMLKPEGWLYIGHAESLLDVTGVQLCGRTIYRKLPT
jgi:chemotaxis protein methyltransferase CheR